MNTALLRDPCFNVTVQSLHCKQIAITQIHDTFQKNGKKYHQQHKHCCTSNGINDGGGSGDINGKNAYRNELLRIFKRSTSNRRFSFIFPFCMPSNWYCVYVYWYAFCECGVYYLVAPTNTNNTSIVLIKFQFRTSLSIFIAIVIVRMREREKDRHREREENEKKLKSRKEKKSSVKEKNVRKHWKNDTFHFKSLAKPPQLSK